MAAPTFHPITRFSAEWLCGQQGVGKTELLLNQIGPDIQSGASVVVMDAKGDLTGRIRKLALGDRLVVVDPRTPFAINPLDIPKDDIRKAINQLEYMIGGLLETNVTPLQKALLRTILRTVVIGIPGATLLTIQDIITNGPGQYQHYIDTNLPDDLRAFFRDEFKDYERTRSELKWRFRLLMENDFIRTMFSAPKTKFKISESMDRGDVVVIDNSIDAVQEDGSAFLGRFFLGQIWVAASARQSRPQHEKKPVYVYIDEAHAILKNDATIAQVIDMARSQAVALILSHQRSKQIEDPNVLNAMENCAIKIANVDAEAHYFSKLLHIPEERMNQLKQGQFALHVRGHGSSIIQVPLATLPFREMTNQEQAAHRVRMIEKYGVETHEGPTEAEPSRVKPELPPEGDKKPILPQSPPKRFKKEEWPD